MNAVVKEDEIQTKINLSPQIRALFDRVLKTQGLNNKDGITRLFQFIGSLPEDVWGLFFAQATGGTAVRAAQIILHEISRRSGNEGVEGWFGNVKPSDDDTTGPLKMHHTEPPGNPPQSKPKGIAASHSEPKSKSHKQK